MNLSTSLEAFKSLNQIFTLQSDNILDELVQTC